MPIHGRDGSLVTRPSTNSSTFMIGSRDVPKATPSETHNQVNTAWSSGRGVDDAHPSGLGDAVGARRVRSSTLFLRKAEAFSLTPAERGRPEAVCAESWGLSRRRTEHPVRGGAAVVHRSPGRIVAASVRIPTNPPIPFLASCDRTITFGCGEFEGIRDGKGCARPPLRVASRGTGGLTSVFTPSCAVGKWRRQ